MNLVRAMGFAAMLIVAAVVAIGFIGAVGIGIEAAFPSLVYGRGAVIAAFLFVFSLATAAFYDKGPPIKSDKTE